MGALSGIVHYWFLMFNGLNFLCQVMAITHSMIELGCSKSQTRDFLQRMCVLHELSERQRQDLLIHLMSRWMAGNWQRFDSIAFRFIFTCFSQLLLIVYLLAINRRAPFYVIIIMNLYEIPCINAASQNVVKISPPFLFYYLVADKHGIIQKLQIISCQQ